VEEICKLLVRASCKIGAYRLCVIPVGPFVGFGTNGWALALEISRLVPHNSASFVVDDPRLSITVIDQGYLGA
jgi:hypothetical protein